MAVLASDESDEKLEDSIKRIDNELNLIAHQEDVPVNVLEIYGYDIEKLRVLSPTELINVSLFPFWLNFSKK
jgi:nuclear pore complex protein Nup133